MSKMLTIYKCPYHGYYAVCIEDEAYQGGGMSIGARLSPEKCCGRWDRVTAWPMTDGELRDAIAALATANTTGE